jgi:hypothetical protein
METIDIKDFDKNILDGDFRFWFTVEIYCGEKYENYDVACSIFINLTQTKILWKCDDPLSKKLSDELINYFKENRKRCESSMRRYEEFEDDLKNMRESSNFSDLFSKYIQDRRLFTFD